MDEKLNSGVARVPAVLQLPPPPPPSVPAPSQPSSSSNPKCVKENQKEQRLRFSVELKPGETTFVSWKRLVKDSGGTGDVQLPRKDARAELAAEDGLPQPGQPVLANQGENDPTEGAPQTNRFSSVIEKIERLYMGRNSSDEEEELDDAPDDDQYDTEDSFIDDTELDEYFQADNLVTKHTGYFVNKGKLEHIESSTPKEPTPKKRRRKDPNTSTTRVYSEKEHKKPQANPSAPHGSKPVKNRPNSSSHKRNIENISSKDLPVLALESRVYNQARIAAGEGYNSSNNNNLGIKEKGVSGNMEVSRGKLVNGENEGKVRKEKKGEFVGPSTSASVYHPVQQMQTPTGVREGSVVRPKGSRLDRAIKDLAQIVAECRPQSTEVQEVDPANPAIKRRLPQDVKLKLAKVARLSSGQDKVTEEQLIDRLMGILGHLVQRKTLKRNIREMVELGLSAKQVKADRFQQIKKEINEMIKSRISSLKSKISEQQQLDGSADDFQQIGYNSGALKGKFTMDSALEDKICDLYDLYVEGMDEDKGPQSRKLYVELADLWPHGYMDNVGIKEAISRSKERKRALYTHRKVQNEERMKRKRLSSQQANNSSNNNNLNLEPKPVQMSTGTQIVPYEKPVPNPNPNPPAQNPSSTNKTLVDPTALYPEYYQNQGSKKLKRKPDADPIESHPNPNPNPIPIPNPVRVSKEKQPKSNKLSDKEEANVSNNNNNNSNNNNNNSRANKGSTMLSFSTDEANLAGGVNFPSLN
ncbi:hypothetical protein LUZ60_001879 [Juncus effusus]|nr:hypothetical protein LUZ60_001879 [Juncus effusus]